MQELEQAARLVAELAPTHGNRAMAKLIEIRIEVEKEMLTTCDVEQMQAHRNSIHTLRNLLAVVNGRPEAAI
jgi:hypothetical protein